MASNIAQTIEKAIQDLVAPDLRELKTTVSGHQKQTEHQFASLQKQIDQRFEAQDQKAETREQKAYAQFRANMAALGEFKAQSELNTLQAISALSERVAILETRRQ